jgi:hypothetical protein
MRIFDSNKFGWVIVMVSLLFIGAQIVRYVVNLIAG